MVHPLTNYVYRKLEKNVPGWPGWSSSSVAHCHPGVASGDRNRGWGRWAVASGCLGPRFPCWVAASPHTLSPTTSHSRATDDTTPRAHSLTTSFIMHGSDVCSSPRLKLTQRQRELRPEPHERFRPVQYYTFFTLNNKYMVLRCWGAGQMCRSKLIHSFSYLWITLLQSNRIRIKKFKNKYFSKRLKLHIYIEYDDC